MKNANFEFSLKSVRNAHKELKGTPCSIIKALYAEAEIDDENGRYLKAVLPAKRQTLLDLAGDICKAYNVGEMRETKRGSYVIKFSADMVFRFLNDMHKAAKNAEKEAAKKVKEAEKAALKAAKDAEKAAKKSDKKAA